MNAPTYVDLVALRIQTNRQIRQDQAAWSSVPLMAPQTWARSWQSTHRREHGRQLRRHRATLASIARQAGEPKPFWKPRSAASADARIARLYRPAVEATALLEWTPAQVKHNAQLATGGKVQPAAVKVTTPAMPTPIAPRQNMMIPGTRLWKRENAVIKSEVARRSVAPAAPAAAPKVRKPRASFAERWNAERIMGRIIAA